MIWSGRHWVLVYSMSLLLWDLCWSFAPVALTDYLKAAIAGEEAASLCWTSWYILPPSEGESGLLKPLFFSTSLAATNTPDAHIAKGFTKHCVHVDYRSLLLLNWLSRNLLSESKCIAGASKPQLLVGDTWDYHNHDICPQINVTPNRAAFALCVSPCLWFLSLLDIVLSPFHPPHLMQSVYWVKVSGL